MRLEHQHPSSQALFHNSPQEPSCRFPKAHQVWVVGWMVAVALEALALVVLVLA
jgi:hypothetical protein